MNEFEITCKAKNNDQEALMRLWGKYRKILIGMIGKYRSYHHLSQSEMESEAFEVLLKKLGIFNPEKVRKDPAVWSFSYMLTRGAGDARNRLKNVAGKQNLEKEYFDEDTTLLGSAQNASSIFTVYDPEKVIDSMGKTPKEKTEVFFKSLTPLQRYALDLRRSGRSIAEVADRMGFCRSTIQCWIADARDLASSVFGIRYGKGRC